MHPPPVQGFRSIRGHAATLELLGRAIERQRVASAYLFVGPQGVGKDRVAHALAQVMNCTTAPLPGLPRDACGECSSCRRIASGNHPDILVLQRSLKDPPEPGSKKAEEVRHARIEDLPESDLDDMIKIGPVRETISRMPFRPHEGGTRWVIVREADRFNQSSGNTFLKTLEEPPDATYFILLTHSPSALLPTIRSRCQVVRFGALDTPDVSAVLQGLGIEAQLADEAAVLGDGSVGRALAYSDAESLHKAQGLARALREVVKVGQPGAFVDLAAQLAPKSSKKKDEDGDEAAPDERELQNVLAMLQRQFRDEALTRAGKDLRNAALFAARAEIVRTTMESLGGASNIKPQLALEAMLVQLREARP